MSQGKPETPDHKADTKGQNMLHKNPRADLETHQVTNQPKPFVGHDLYAIDPALTDAVKARGGEQHAADFSEFGTKCGADETQD